MGFQAAARKADPAILEPIMKVEVVTPESFLGDVMGDLNSRRGVIQGTSERGNNKDDAAAKISNGVHRLNEQNDIRAVLRRGRKIESLLFRATFRKNPFARLRFTSVASRAIDKRAVVRNRLRRRAREWVCTRSGRLNEPFDIVIVFKKNATVARRKNFY